MLLTLLDKNKISDYVLPKKISGKYIINTTDKEEKNTPLIAVEEEKGKWFLKSNKRAIVKTPLGETNKKVEIIPQNIYRVVKEEGELALLFAQEPTEDTYIFSKYKVTSKKIIIGRNKDCDISYSNKLVSSNHCYLEFNPNGEVKVVDTNSSNGTYVNGSKIREATLNIGDVIYIMGLKIIFNGGN
ncbi:MAG: FHA domain-containing protein [Clostridium sp.]